MIVFIYNSYLLYVLDITGYHAEKYQSEVDYKTDIAYSMTIDSTTLNTEGNQIRCLYV